MWSGSGNGNGSGSSSSPGADDLNPRMERLWPPWPPTPTDYEGMDPKDFKPILLNKVNNKGDDVTTRTKDDVTSTTTTKNEEKKMNFVPFNRWVQRIVLYETRSHFYLVGSNESQSKFRVLKVDRSEPKHLQLLDDGIIYERQEIRDLLHMIEVGNRSKIGQKIGSGLNKTTSAYGLVGFVRFLEGYYLILITSRRKTGIIGHHSVYKIENTATVYIPNDEVRSMD